MKTKEKLFFPIGGHNWELKFVDKKEIEGNDGLCKPNDFIILIRKDLKKETASLVFAHEVVHAILDTQGRCYQKRFNIEEVCEFVAWQNDTVHTLVKVFNELVHE